MQWAVWKSNRWVRRLAVGVATVLALWLLSWLAVPPLAKHYAQKIASEQLGRTVQIGAIDFRPWSLELTVSDIRVAAAGTTANTPPQLQIQRLYVDAELQSLLRLAPVVDAITVDAPQLRLTHLGDGHYDIDDIMARLQPVPGAPAGDPLHFALYNIALNGGTVDFTDRSVDATHLLREVHLAVPFLSNLDSQREVKVEPRLAFQLNGSRFDSAAAATPFAQTRKTDASIRLAGFDLQPYLGYLPASLPVRLRSGVVDADLKLHFTQSPQPAVQLTGELALGKVRLADGRGRDLLDFDRLKLVLADVRPLARAARLASVDLRGPVLVASRDATGQLNLPPAAGEAKATSKTIATKPEKTLATAQKDIKNAASAPSASASGTGAPAAAAPAWAIDVASVTLQGGTVRWSDDTTRPAIRLPLTDIALQAQAVAWPPAAPATFSGSAALEKTGLRFSGSATAERATVTAAISALPLARLQPYVATVLQPPLAGTLAAELGLQWQGGQLTLAVPQLQLTDTVLGDSKSPLAGLKSLALADGSIDLERRSASLGKLVVNQPQLQVQRDKEGRWMVERWLAAAPPAAASATAAASAPAPRPPAAPSAAPERPWTVALGELAVDGGRVSLADAALHKPVALAISNVRVGLRNFATDARKPSPLTVSARVGTGQGGARQDGAGQIDYRGSLRLAPLALEGAVQASKLPLHALEPYFGEALNIELLRADASFKGDVRHVVAAAGASTRVRGDVALDDVRAIGAPAPGAPTDKGLQQDEEILSWKTLGLRGVALDTVPGSPLALSVAETALGDFFARIVVNDNGRINLQDLTRASASATAAAATPVASSPNAPKNEANNVQPLPATAPNDVQTATAGAASGLEPDIRFGPVSLVNGRVYFSDRFIRPNYSANLSDLTGKLTAFASQPPAGGAPALADLELRGRAEGTASLEITGKLNPLAKPLALDITGKVRDLELPPLSPYAIKYAGYGIERGKLSLDVNYTVQPDGQLTARNQFVLNQLSFGEKVEGAPNSLPVKLAVALLADRNGVIDINLPISGSLNDPQFSIGPIVFKLIVNLIVKAVTSPFTLLASALGGGGDELGTVAFAPGATVLSADARQSLDKVVKALQARPALNLTVVGTASLAVEREGYRRERLQQMLLAEKRRATGQPAVVVTAQESPALLKDVYRRADFPKPRNLIGLAKDLTPAEMEALLLANIPVSDEAMRELAQQRGLAVRDYLAGQQLPAERLFLGAARTVPGDAAWRPRAELNLAMR